MTFGETQYFTQEEFDSPDELGSGAKMSGKFIEKLHCARSLTDIPFRITSGYRTVEHNKKVGGVWNSSHLIGKAADIGIRNSSDRFLIIEALIAVGFKRIGVGKSFIHVDLDRSKPYGIMFDYYKPSFLKSLFNFNSDKDI